MSAGRAGLGVLCSDSHATDSSEVVISNPSVPIQINRYSIASAAPAAVRICM